jgi:hypothetical protein
MILLNPWFLWQGGGCFRSNIESKSFETKYCVCKLFFCYLICITKCHRSFNTGIILVEINRLIRAGGRLGCILGVDASCGYWAANLSHLFPLIYSQFAYWHALSLHRCLILCSGQLDALLLLTDTSWWLHELMLHCLLSLPINDDDEYYIYSSIAHTPL